MRRHVDAAGAVVPLRIGLALLGASLIVAHGHADEPSRSNVFDDPFVQVSAGLPDCPVPDVPGVTAQEARELAHDRAQRGVSCWLAGRCRLANAYLYDAEIIPRVQQALRYSGRFADTSIWASGQRRIVWLQGCVSSAGQAADAEQFVRRIDDVEGVVNQLMIGTGGAPAYRVAPR
ncbi:MAG TPA: BON domain-containing protein [Burkholderiaceae bacterium]|jgi:hypothetical protein|nr:BON domain-containing protein [Burkholderiaceae bacterium]